MAGDAKLSRSTTGGSLVIKPKDCDLHAFAFFRRGATRPDARWQPDKVVAPETLLARMDMAAVEAMVEQSRAESAPAEETPDYAVDVEAFSGEITFDDFAKVDLRIGVVEEATFVEGAKKLLQLTVHLLLLAFCRPS